MNNVESFSEYLFGHFQTLKLPKEKNCLKLDVNKEVFKIWKKFSGNEEHIAHQNLYFLIFPS